MIKNLRSKLTLEKRCSGNLKIKNWKSGNHISLFFSNQFLSYFLFLVSNLSAFLANSVSFFRHSFSNFFIFFSFFPSFSSHFFVYSLPYLHFLFYPFFHYIIIFFAVRYTYFIYAYIQVTRVIFCHSPPRTA